jgi:hypothetical protein
MARTMLNEHSLPKYFWAEAINAACYIINRVVIRSKLEKTPYELGKEEHPILVISKYLVVNALF